MSPILLVERVDGVAVVTLNRPEVRNALSSELRAELRSQIEQLDLDATIGAIILTGADPAFCAGVDMRELESGLSQLNPVGPNTAPFAAVHKPLIGAINGPTYTG